MLQWHINEVTTCHCLDWVKFLYKQELFYHAVVISFSGHENFKMILFYIVSLNFDVISNSWWVSCFARALIIKCSLFLSYRFYDVEVIKADWVPATCLVNDLWERFRRSWYGKKDLMRRVIPETKQKNISYCVASLFQNFFRLVLWYL